MSTLLTPSSEGEPCEICGRPTGGCCTVAVHDIGGGVLIRLDKDGGGLLWQHRDRRLPDGRPCRAWMPLRYRPDPKSTGHVLVSQWPMLTIEGSLLCPAGCGMHGLIRGGRWVP